MVLRPPNRSAARAARPAAARRRQRGSMLILCLGVIVAMLLLATAFLATVMNRRDQYPNTSFPTYTESIAESGLAIASLLLDESPAADFPGLHALRLNPNAATHNAPYGINGLNDGGGDDNRPFLQPRHLLLPKPGNMTYGGRYVDSGEQRLVESDIGLRPLWMAALRNPNLPTIDPDAPVGDTDNNNALQALPFNRVWDWQHPLQPLGIEITELSTPNDADSTMTILDTLGNVHLARYDKDMNIVTSDVRYYPRLWLHFTDFSGCLPLGVPDVVDNPGVFPTVAEQNAAKARLAWAIGLWGVVNPNPTPTNSDGTHTSALAASLFGKIGTVPNQPYLPFALVNSAGGGESGNAKHGRWVAAQTMDELAARTTPDNTATTRTDLVTQRDWDDLRATNLLAELCPPARAIPYTYYSAAGRPGWTDRALLHNLRDGDHGVAAGNDKLRTLQTPAVSGTTNPYYFLNANSASLRTLVAVHLATQRELVAGDAAGTVPFYIEDTVNTVADASLASRLKTALTKAATDADVNAVTGIDDVVEAFAAALVDTVKNTAANAYDDFGWVNTETARHRDPARAWALRQYRGSASDVNLHKHRRLLRYHHPDHATRTTAVATDQESSAIAYPAGTLLRPDAANRSEGWTHHITDLNTDTAAATPPILKITVEREIDVFDVGNEYGPITVTEFAWDGANAYKAPMPTGELLWGIRHPFRYADTDAGGRDDGLLPYVPIDDLDATRVDGDFVAYSHHFQVELTLEMKEHLDTDADGTPDAWVTTVISLAPTADSDSIADWKEDPDVAPNTERDALAALAGEIKDAFHEMERDLFVTLGQHYQPVARLFCNQGGGAYRVLARGELWDAWNEKAVATSDLEFHFVPDFNRPAFDAASPTVEPVDQRYKPALSNIPFRRWLNK